MGISGWCLGTYVNRSDSVAIEADNRQIVMEILEDSEVEEEDNERPALELH